MINHGELWTQEEDDYLQVRKGKGGWRLVAKKMGRSESACRARYSRLNDSQRMPRWWTESYNAGRSDYPRTANKPGGFRNQMAYMAGWNDKELYGVLI